jgi:hypothetical protein
MFCNRNIHNEIGGQHQKRDLKIESCKVVSKLHGSNNFLLETDSA